MPDLITPLLYLSPYIALLAVLAAVFPAAVIPKGDD
jgi:hypothetical protein